MAYISGNSGEWEYVIGIEVHAQISSNSKLFSGSSTSFGASPNSQVSLVDAAMPGMLPVLNEYCVKQAIKTGLALSANINKYSVFDRKNYFYPDLPQGYQISQFYHPIVQNGMVDIVLEDGTAKHIRINRLHLEQDAGKSIHDQSPRYSFVDLNRSGIALMEIVTEPDIYSPFEAGEYIKKLRSILRHIGTCDGDMEKGSMRCDVNVSVRKAGEELGTRCEIKNVNSIKNVIKAIEYEGARQVEMLENGEKILQETRLFDADSGKTRSMRLKENSNDYRYFPDPDLLPVRFSQEFIDDIATTLPELPDAKINRYITKLGLSNYDAQVLAQDIEVAQYFEQAIQTANPKMTANWICGELFAQLNKSNISILQCKITPSKLAEMVNLIDQGVISGKIAKTIFEIMFTSGRTPKEIVDTEGMTQISDNNAIIAIIDEVLIANPEMVSDYRGGREKLFGFFVGQVMKKTAGKASPSLVNDLLKEKLSQ